jgi:hypothetical protein
VLISYYTENQTNFPFYIGSWEKDKELDIMRDIIQRNSSKIYCSLIMISHRNRRIEQPSFNFKDDITLKCNNYDKLEPIKRNIIKA